MNDPFEGLRIKLESEKDWPKIYYFKFILPNNNQKLALVEAAFGEEAMLSVNQSSGGKYLSVSAKEMMLNPNEVIERYAKVQDIEGIIAL